MDDDQRKRLTQTLALLTAYHESTAGTEPGSSAEIPQFAAMVAEIWQSETESLKQTGAFLDALIAALDLADLLVQVLAGALKVSYEEGLQQIAIAIATPSD